MGGTMGLDKFKRICAVMALGCLAQPAFSQASPAGPVDPAVDEESARQDRRGLGNAEARTIIAPLPVADTGAQAILVGAIHIEGLVALPPSAFAPTVQAYAGRSLDPEALRALATDIAAVARRAGFGLATAWIPQQRSVNGVLKVIIDEGRVDAIEIEGNGGAAARPMLAPLADGRPVRTAELERRLLLAGDIAGVTLGRARLERRDGRSILHITARQDRLAARASVDNWGSDAVGPVRARVTFDLNGVAARNDQLSVSGVMTPFAPGEFSLVRASYTMPVGTNGTEFNLGGYYARSKPGAALRDRDIFGRSVEAEAGVRHPFLRTRAASLWGDISFRLRDARQSEDNIVERQDRLATVSASAFGALRLTDGRARGRLTLVQGLNVLGATRDGDPLASRDDADGEFTKVQLWAEYVHRFDRRWSIKAEAEGQIASGPLLSSEEMGLGGRTLLRGYEYRERSGDRGAAGSIELRFDLAGLPKPVSDVQIYAFADAGTVGNDRSGYGGGSLASAGGGIRFQAWDRVELGLELGVPLKDRLDPSDRKSPRISFTLGSRF